MSCHNKSIKLVVVAGPVGTTPREMSRAFIFDEAFMLAKKGLTVHVVRSSLFDHSYEVSYGIHFHNLGGYISLDAFRMVIKNLPKYPAPSLLRKIYLIYWENLYASRVTTIIRRTNATIIHAHFAYPEGFVGLLAKRETKRPLVISVWGRDVQADPDSGYGALTSRRTADLVREALSNADAIIASALNHYWTVIKLIGDHERQKVFYLPPGIDTSRFHPSINGSVVRRVLGIQEDQNIVLFPKHLHRIYGVELLIRAASKVVKEHPNTIFLILGDGPLLSYLKSLTNNLGIERNVRFVGQVPRSLMPFFYAASDIVVDPTIFGQGYAALEAMACGKPVIGFRTGQVKIADKLSGYLVEPYDIEALADRIALLLGDPELRRQMGKNARMYVERNFSLERRINMLINIYDRILGQL